MAVPPAHAGIDPNAWKRTDWSPWFPRTRGDRVKEAHSAPFSIVVPPHTRG